MITSDRRRYTTFAVLAASLWLLLADNLSYWRLLLEAADGRPGFAFSLLLFSFAVVTLLLSLLAVGRSARYVLATVLCLSAAAAYFMDSLGIVIDREMIENVFQTDRAEALEQLNPGLLLSVFLVGVLPSAVVWKLLPARQSLGNILREKVAMTGLALALAVLAVAPFYKDYASLFRNHREIRHLLTPVNYMSGSYRYLSDLATPIPEIAAVGTDARKGSRWNSLPRKVVSVVVVGETARADNFSLFGYVRPTNPRLSSRQLIRFDDVSACGTSTAVSIPCMFSDIGRADYDRSTVRAREGLLDVLAYAGLDTVWLENNSGCKGVCRNATVWTSAGLDIGGVCENGECFDSVLLEELDRELARIRKDTVIFVHMNGSHGPSYYRRAPDAFHVFTPECRSDELTDCTREQIRNSYDNTIVYTDWFLDEVIDRLERVAGEMDTSLLYVSDHGESLGEYGLYLHGAPYYLAPGEQTHVPMLLWLSRKYQDDFRIDAACLRQKQSQPLSHDNLFHSVLGMLDVATVAHRADLDLFTGCGGEEPFHASAVAPSKTAAGIQGDGVIAAPLASS